MRLRLPPETVLGELCTWVNQSPDLRDVGRYECRTEDGVPLRARFLVRVGAMAIRRYV
jgi:hypothetical protein